MHARVTTATFQLDKIAEATRVYTESILPGVKAAAGNQGVTLLINETTGIALSITYWATEADGQAYDASGSYRELVGKVAPFFAAAPSLATYTVGAQS